MQTFSLKIPPPHWNHQRRKELALHLYREGIISYANARRLAGMRRVEVHYSLNIERIGHIRS